MKNLLLISVLMFFISANARAVDFVVTSNADSGSGTLREAIGLAAANGTLSKDFILFKLQVPVIELLTSLPALSTNLQIDGANQGVKLGISDAGVSIMKASSLPLNAHIDIFTGDNLQIVEIYSMHFPQLQDGNLTSTPISFSNSSSVTVGEPGRGNVFGAVDTDLKMRGCQQIRISANWFGLKPDKTPDTLVPSNSALELIGCGNINLGGASPEEGNIFIGRYIGPRIIGRNASYPGVVVIVGELCYIRNNTFGLQGVTQPAFIVPLVLSNQRNVFILGNKSYLSAGFNISAITEALTIQGNTLGITGSSTRHFNLNDVNQTLIGGTQPGDANTFINATTSGAVYTENCGDVTILGNSIYCLENGLVYFSERSKVLIPEIKINSLTNGIIIGTATPNSDIEVFNDGTCNKCEAGSLLRKTKADAQGNWQSPFPSGNGSTASATLNNRTSLFAMLGNDITQAYLINPTCGKSNGSIRGIVILNGTSTRWVNSKGEVVGTSNDLVDVPAGTYTLTSFMGACASKATTYTLYDAGIEVKTDKAIALNTSCGLDNGSVTGLVLNNTGATIKSIEWKNEKNEVKGLLQDLLKAAPGTYMLYITTENDCVVTAGPYTLLASEPVVDRSVEKVVNADCGFPTGSITGPSIKAGRPPYFYQWKDDTGKLLSSTQLLQNLVPGIYTLTMGDASDCGSQTFVYEVGSNPGFVARPVANDVRICSVGKATIRASGSGPGIFVLYSSEGIELLRDPDGVFEVTVDGNTGFFVEKRSGSCISERVAVKVLVTNDGLTKVNTITPNGDGINDYWDIPDIDAYPNARIQLYNRYGQNIYQSVGYKTPFDGRRNGRELPAGTYYYIIDLRQGCTLLRGSITVLR